MSRCVQAVEKNNERERIEMPTQYLYKSIMVQEGRVR